MTSLLFMLSALISVASILSHTPWLGLVALVVAGLGISCLTGTMQRWAIAYASLHPYFHLGDYQQRFWLLPFWCLKPNPVEGGFVPKRWVLIRPRVHIYGRGDREKHLHDHPADNITWVLQGEFWEQVPFSKEPSWDFKNSDRPEATRERYRGKDDVVFRLAQWRHKIVISQYAKDPLITLFIFGPKRREWGFTTPKGWVHWREYLNAREAS